jgi:hypothetical protein
MGHAKRRTSVSTAASHGVLRCPSVAMQHVARDAAQNRPCYERRGGTLVATDFSLPFVQRMPCASALVRDGLHKEIH